jgi:two-component system OmpR family sensor kinase
MIEGAPARSDEPTAAAPPAPPSPPSPPSPPEAPFAGLAPVPAPPQAASRRAHWHLLPRTLAARLVAGVVALVIVVVAAAGGATYAELRPFLLQKLNQQVDPLATVNARTIQRCLSVLTSTCPLTTNGTSIHSPQKQWLQVLSPPGAATITVTESDDLLSMGLSGSDQAAIIADPNRMRTVTAADGSSLRVAARVVSVAGVGTYVVVTGLSMDQVNSTLHQLLLLELVIGAGAVGLALLATTVGVRLSLRPLHRVTATARTVAAELSPEGTGLDRRVEVTDPASEVGQLGESMNTLLGAVGAQFAARLESERRMRQFLADASHELRTPLTSIRGYAELARMRRATGATSGEDDSMDRIESEGTRMSRLVEDLLTLARGDQDAPAQRTTVDVAELVADAVEGARASYPQRRIDVVLTDRLAVWGEQDKLLRVLRNLITNAAVHTAAGGPIRVSAARLNGWIVLQVADSGPGLPPEQAAHVFERFWRADSSRARSSGGSGLGLAIVQSIIEAHGGRIEFASAVATGSTVTVYLPAG